MALVLTQALFLSLISTSLGTVDLILNHFIRTHQRPSVSAFQAHWPTATPVKYEQPPSERLTTVSSRNAICLPFRLNRIINGSFHTFNGDNMSLASYLDNVPSLQKSLL